MRIRPTWLALGFAFVALSAQAQTASRPARPADADAFSVFVYDRISATPSLRWPLAARAGGAAQPRAAAAAKVGDEDAAPVQAGKRAAVVRGRD